MFLSKIRYCLHAHFIFQEYEEISIRRIQQHQNLKHRPDQFTIIVREIPLCIEHKAYDCCVDQFFSKHYPNTYYSYQMVYGTEDLEESVVRNALLRLTIQNSHSWSLLLLDENLLLIFCMPILKLDNDPVNEICLR